jgi:hypothetical protein
MAAPRVDDLARWFERNLRAGNKSPGAGPPWRSTCSTVAQQAGTPTCIPTGSVAPSVHERLSAGGNETELMRIAGWCTREAPRCLPPNVGGRSPRAIVTRVAIGDSATIITFVRPSLQCDGRCRAAVGLSGQLCCRQ